MDNVFKASESWKVIRPSPLKPKISKRTRGKHPDVYSKVKEIECDFTIRENVPLEEIGLFRPFQMTGPDFGV
jgi:hypothetical protein